LGGAEIKAGTHAWNFRWIVCLVLYACYFELIEYEWHRDIGGISGSRRLAVIGPVFPKVKKGKKLKSLKREELQLI